MSLNKRSRLKLSPKEYKKLCLSVMERDNWKCQCPGCKSRNNLHCHHIIFRSGGGDDAEWNLLTLCDSCHRALHERYWYIESVTTEIKEKIKSFTPVFNTTWRPGKNIC